MHKWLFNLKVFLIGKVSLLFFKFQDELREQNIMMVVKIKPK